MLYGLPDISFFELVVCGILFFFFYKWASKIQDKRNQKAIDEINKKFGTDLKPY